MKFGEQMVSSSEGTRALALQLCREFEDKFLLHLTGGEVSSFFIFFIQFIEARVHSVSYFWGKLDMSEEIGAISYVPY